MGITSIHFSGFKSLENYSVSFKSFNVLVGPNNAGKSTVLDGLRLMWGALRFARQRKPSHLIETDDGLPSGWGWPIQPSSFPFDLENIHTNYHEQPAAVSVRLENGNRLTLRISGRERAYLYTESDGTFPRSTTAFRANFDIRPAIIPTLGPLEREEAIVEPDYVNRVAWSHRASRLFRNLWYSDGAHFSDFRALVETTWPGMSIDPPDRAELLSNRLVMFCKEHSITREVAWAGSGFQIWLQLLTHIVRARDANILVVDEPEIYLHPDLQRQIVHVLRKHPAQVVLATHSVEVINEVDPSDLLLVERDSRSARRLTDITELDQATQLLGSSQNMQLSRLARARRVLFVEGQDKQILSRLASKLDLDVFSTGKLAVIPIDGFSQYQKVASAQWAFMKVLGESIQVAVLLDRDYRCEEEILSIQAEIQCQTAHLLILPFKEIENCLLAPRAIQAAIDNRVQGRVDRGTLKEPLEIDGAAILFECADSIKEDVRAQLASSELRFHRSSGRDASSILSAHGRKFEEDWRSPQKRLSMVPGKEVLAMVNTALHNTYGISISASQIIRFMHREEINEDLAGFLRLLATMISKQP